MAAPSNFMDVYRRHVRPACAVIKELWPVYEVCAAFSPAVTNRTEYIRHEAKQLGRRSFAEPRLVDASLASWTTGGAKMHPSSAVPATSSLKRSAFAASLW